MSGLSMLIKLSSRAAGFGPRLAPGPLVGRNYDCEDVGHLTYYMLTGNPRVGLAGEIAPPGKLVVRTNTVNIEVSVDDQFGASFFDFLECCNREESSLESLLKVRRVGYCERFERSLQKCSIDSSTEVIPAF